ncbi:MAG: 2-phospho-L-lactate guanylyltransferase [Acidimicrobiales bacterium]
MRALLVPVKAFHDAKLRLAGVLAPADRSALARELAARVIRAAGELPVSVVCDDHDVAAFAESLGAAVIWTPGLGLSGAVSTGVEHLGKLGVKVVVVSHADLPGAKGFDHIGDEDGAVTIVADRSFDGTNVIAVPTGAGFGFAYGAGSFKRHCAEARRLGLLVRVVEDQALAADVDLPADLVLVERLVS